MHVYACACNYDSGCMPPASLSRHSSIEFSVHSLTKESADDSKQSKQTRLHIYAGPPPLALCPPLIPLFRLFARRDSLAGFRSLLSRS